MRPVEALWRRLREEVAYPYCHPPPSSGVDFLDGGNGNDMLDGGDVLFGGGGTAVIEIEACCQNFVSAKDKGSICLLSSVSKTWR